MIESVICDFSVVTSANCQKRFYHNNPYLVRILYRRRRRNHLCGLWIWFPLYWDLQQKWPVVRFRLPVSTRWTRQVRLVLRVPDQRLLLLPNGRRGREGDQQWIGMEILYKITRVNVTQRRTTVYQYARGNSRTEFTGIASYCALIYLVHTHTISCVQLLIL